MSTQIPGVPFDPRRTGPLDLLAAKYRSLSAWAAKRDRELLAAGVLLVVVQAIVYATHGVVFLDPPTLPNWFLVMIGVTIFWAPIASLVGVLLGKGLYDDSTVMVVEQSAVTGDQRIRHLAPEVFDAAEIRNQNGEVRERDYLQKVRVNGREAYEVDCYDEDGNRIVASSMAGRTNRDVRADRHAIANIKTEMEREVDEAIEMKVNFRDIVRQRAATVANWVIRTAQGATIPDGEDLYDEMQSSLDEVDPYGDLHSPGDAAAGQPDDDDRDVDGPSTNGEQADLDPDSSMRDIFERAMADGGTDE